ncbi:MAG: VOC family protein [Pseudomonadota bacterium]
MAVLGVREIKAFVPARNYERSKAFYQALGFELGSDTEGIAYFYRGSSAFLLQDFYRQEHAENFMMHLLVDDVAAWHQQIQAKEIPERFSVRLSPVEIQPWGMRDFTLTDPTGVLWRIAELVDT